jgi:hypothetical protein
VNEQHDGKDGQQAREQERPVTPAIVELARTAATRAWRVPIGADERKALAKQAILTKLATEDPRPDPETLVRSAVQAIWQAGGAGIQVPDEIAVVASPSAGLSLGPDLSEDRLVGCIALGQAWAQLSSIHQAALSAHMRHGSVARAAAALGLSRNRAYARVLEAQTQLQRIWTGDE